MSIGQEGGFIMCDLCMDLVWEFNFPNSRDMLQDICIGMLVITSFLSAQLPFYCLLRAFLFSMPISPDIHLQLL